MDENEVEDDFFDGTNDGEDENEDGWEYEWYMKWKIDWNNKKWRWMGTWMERLMMIWWKWVMNGKYDGEKWWNMKWIWWMIYDGWKMKQRT